MRKDAEKDGAQWAAHNDSRVTRVGAILRKTHIDEIPQLWNIIKGDLALVGPRPERPEFVEKLKQEIPYYFLRHIVKPGFTGWAQIKYRYARTVDDSREKFEYDLYYIKNRSLLLDLGIVVKTVQIIFTH
jgi:lipopolysaccharide/colanic/teichoic acid biosynthesis glycosyltransferase